jgi:LysM repeat protein
MIMAGLVAALLLTACGGGSGKSPAKDQVAGPAEVPSSTPIQKDAPLYLIAGDTITTKNGATATVEGNPGGGNSGSSSQSYTVVAGDTCYGIASQFGITIDQLYQANGGENGACSTLTAGNVMHIPAPATATTTPTPSAGGGTNNGKTPTSTATPKAGGGGNTYTVQAGDTCYGIATALGIDPDAFVQANSAACGDLHEGDTLTAP